MAPDYFSLPSYVTEPGDSSNSAAGAAKVSHERNQEQYQKDHEYQLRDPGRSNRYAGKTQHRRDQRYYKKRYGPIKHCATSVNFAGTIIGGNQPRPNRIETVSSHPQSGKSRASISVLVLGLPIS
jgi:hypothetical protein